LIATVAIFLPSALLMLGALPHWATLAANERSRGALAAVNAAVVGLLGAALYDPVFTQGIDGAPALLLAVAAYVALAHWKAPVWLIVPAAGVLGAVLL
jgi:chromate transporter